MHVNLNNSQIYEEKPIGEKGSNSSSKEGCWSNNGKGTRLLQQGRGEKNLFKFEKEILDSFSLSKSCTLSWFPLTNPNSLPLLKVPKSIIWLAWMHDL